ncbi:substrate-binding domain-containing protein [Kribbella flavida]|uniref:substrate-binding domain-containing protein n=1 Tax=Kribbella flavida TaxID=182640 RepID=UPI001ED97663|nr:substrate-binding domain-containing protein [Kribbella flavida]
MTRSNNSRRPVYLTAVGLLVLALGAVFVVRSFGSEAGADGILGGSCDQPTQVKLSTTPEFQPVLEQATKALSARGGKDGAPCLQFTITAAQSSSVARELASGGDSRPDLWVPDSSLWVSRADDGESVPTIAVPSIATSPLVLVGRSENFANTSSWLGTFAETQPALLDPLSSSSGTLSLLAIQAERAKTSASNTQVAQVLVPLAQRLGSMAKQYTEVNGPLSKASADGSNVVVPVSEQAFVKHQDEHPEAQLKAVVPGTGTLVLDYPVVVTARNNAEAVTAAGKALAEEMLSDASSQARDEGGFRDHLVSPLGEGRGEGEVTQLTKPTVAAVEKILQSWTTLSLSAHSLAVIDVSGSMAEKVAGSAKTRMQLTIEAADNGLKMFPDSAELGLWVFSTKIGPDSADFRQLVPIGKLTPGHRQRMIGQLKAQSARVGGGTGLYDTAIAAVRAVRSSYNSGAVNTVLLFTDGKNDDPGSLSLDRTLQILNGLKDPARPVRIIALGIGPDADADELKRLAQATGGQAYVARNPTDLKDVFIDALQSR